LGFRVWLPGLDVDLPRPPPPAPVAYSLEREFFIYKLLVSTHFIIEMILVDRPCAMGVVQVALYLPS
jgi:hypothetical protein